MKINIKSVQLTISIHGLDTDEDALDFLKGLIREETKAALLGKQKGRFNFRDESDNDIEVEIVDTVATSKH